MKKLFISVPMNGRSEEDIKKSMKKMHEAAEVLIGEELEVIQSYVEHTPPENVKKEVWYIGQSIQKLSEADYIAVVDDIWWDYYGCRAEHNIAQDYDIPLISLDGHCVCPDIYPRICCCENDAIPCTNVKEA